MPQELNKHCANLAAHRQHPLLLLQLSTIDRTQVLTVSDELKGKNYPHLDVMLITPGGDPDSAFLITKILRKHAKKLTFLIPVYAKSAGTLMCLGADELVMTEISELGPLDSQIREEQEGSSPRFNSALNGFKALEQVQLHTLQTLEIAARMIRRHGMRLIDVFELANKFSGQTSGTLYAQLDPKKIGEYARALDVGEKYGVLILTRYMGWPKEKAAHTVRRLVKEYPSHGFVLDIDEVQDVGLPAAQPDDNTEQFMDLIRNKFIELDDETRIKLFIPTPTATSASGNVSANGCSTVNTPSPEALPTVTVQPTTL